MKLTEGAQITFTYRGKQVKGNFVKYNDDGLTCIVRRINAPIGRTFHVDEMEHVSRVK